MLKTNELKRSKDKECVGGFGGFDFKLEN